MPIIKFKEPSIKLGQEYSAVIQRIEVRKDWGRLHIFVELEDQPGITYLKSIRYSESVQGELARFFDDLQVMNRKNEVNTEHLEGREVIVTFNKGKDGNYYVKEMWLVDDEEDESDEFGYDEDDELDLDEE